MATMRVFATSLCLLMGCLHSVAQDKETFEDYKKRKQQEFADYRKQKRDDFEAYRRKVNEDYAAFVEKKWRAMNALKERLVPEDRIRPVPPRIFPKGEPQPQPKPLPFDEVTPVPKPKPQPQPIAPIEDKKMPDVPTVDFTFFGTTVKVRYDQKMRIRLNSTDEQSIAKAWKELSTERNSQLLADCLRFRKERHLCDWAYIEMLHSLTTHLLGKDTNEATLLLAYLYCQSGYQMRLARGEKGDICLLYASDHLIYNKPYFVIGGQHYYPYGNAPKTMFVCEAAFPQEKSLSLLIPQEQEIDLSVTPVKKRQAERYPEVATSMTSNKNLMDFYSTYPTSMHGGDLMTRWAMYANTPMSNYVKEQLYPTLQKAISECSQLQAVEKLLNYVQTGFTYEYDEKVWGRDRAFFAEESLFYPYCDCEDRSILFTRLVRDLLGLDCVLIYYPGHLASAVAFTEETVSGDYLQLGNRRFTVTDPTYIGAPVGRTMPGMDNQTAKVILLQR